MYEAVNAGARLTPACREAGLSLRTWRRWQQQPEDRRPEARRPRPANRLTAQEEQRIREVCPRPEHAALPPGEIVPRLADAGEYIASGSTFYRVLRRHGEVRHRGRSRAPTQVRRPLTWTARGPCQVWTWDITRLPSRVRGRWFYLYLIEDIFSRRITGYEVYEEESGSQAALLMQRTVLREGCWREPLVLHADNGAAMTSQTLKAKPESLKITGSHSRPRVSNDNSYVETLFRTLKYVPEWPSEGFTALAGARKWVARLVQWYNDEHRHGEISCVTPSQRPRGEDAGQLKARREVCEGARRRHPERWSGSRREWAYKEAVTLNPDRENTVQKKAA